MMAKPLRFHLRWAPLAAGAIVLAAVGCARQPDRPAWPPFGGVPARGAATITSSACGACHAIPGVGEANGLVGPPLDHFSRRTIIAGLLPNTPANLVKWIRYPQAVVPGNAMPDSGLTDAQARDVAAYLYTLK